MIYNFVLRNTILVYDMPIVFRKDLVKQFLLVGLSNSRAVICIYFRQLNASTPEQGEAVFATLFKNEKRAPSKFLEEVGNI